MTHICKHEDCTRLALNDDLTCGAHARFQWRHAEPQAPFAISTQVGVYCQDNQCSEIAMSEYEFCETHANVKHENFDGARAAWMRNKIKVGANFRYACGVHKSNGLFCKRRIYRNLTNKKFNNTCRGHCER